MKNLVGALIILVSSLSFSAETLEKPATFISAIQSGDYHQALVLWPTSKEASHLTANNQALYAFALLKDKMPYLAINELNRISNLKAVSSSTKSLWNKELNVNSEFWRTSGLTWSKKWAGFFTNDISYALAAWPLRDLQTDAQFGHAQSLLRNLEGTEPGAWVKWQLALGYGLKDRTAAAVDYLQSLIDSEQKAIGQDQVLITAARFLYQDNKLDKAMKYYEQIPKNSDFWLEALEEKAWIFAKLNNFERTLGEMKTVLNPAFAAQVGPESYFLTTLAHLRVCDYYSIFKVLKQFRTYNSIRIVEIQNLADVGHTATSDKALAKLEQGVQRWDQLGADTDKLPRFVNRDEILSRAVAQRRLAHEELRQAQSLASSNSYYSTLAVKGLDISKEKEKLAPARLKAMATTDVAEMKKNLMKLQIVETEAIHRMHVGQTFAQKVNGGQEKSQVKDRIDFPFEEKEVWLDELGHYEASAKGCPAGKKGQKL